MGGRSRVERRADEVLPADMDGYRERVGRARQMLNVQRMRMNLLDLKALESSFAGVSQRLRVGEQRLMLRLDFAFDTVAALLQHVLRQHAEMTAKTGFPPR